VRRGVTSCLKPPTFLLSPCGTPAPPPPTASARSPGAENTGTSREARVHPAFPEQEFFRIAEARLLAAPVAGEYGGMGFGAEPGRGRHLLHLLKRIGYGNLSVGRLYEGHANAIQLIQTYGSSEQIKRYSRDAVEHRLIFGVWNTEMGDGVKIHPAGHGRYRLEGAKTFASGAGSIQRPLVTGALPDGGWQMFIVPADLVVTDVDPSWWKPIGMRSSATFKINFTGIELTQDDLIGEPGDYHSPPWFTGGAIGFAAVQLGGAQALLDETRWFLQKTGRIEDPFQRQRIGTAQIAAEAGNLWLERAGMMLDRALTATTDEEFEQITVTESYKSSSSQNAGPDSFCFINCNIFSLGTTRQRLAH
jgi:alkylation response protein AidB-like acyl-CoA dehydrogenase